MSVTILLPVFHRGGALLVLSLVANACVPARARVTDAAPASAGAAASSKATGPRTSRSPAPSMATVAVAKAAAPADDIEYLRTRELMVPVHGIAPGQVQNNFAAPRGSRSHNAIDIMAPRGTPVLAADDGRILSMRRNTAGGLTIYLVDADERLVHYYAHLDGYRKGLDEGDAVRKGDVIGYVGTTGNAPANTPHLHFQVMRLDDRRRYWEGTPLNPHPHFAVEGRQRED